MNVPLSLIADYVFNCILSSMLRHFNPNKTYLEEDELTIWNKLAVTEFIFYSISW